MDVRVLGHPSWPDSSLASAATGCWSASPAGPPVLLPPAQSAALHVLPTVSSRFFSQLSVHCSVSVMAVSSRRDGRMVPVDDCS